MARLSKRHVHRACDWHRRFCTSEDLQMMRPTWLNLAIVVLNVGVGIATAFVVYALFFEQPRLTYLNVPFPVDAKPLRHGDVIPVTVRYCVTGDAPLTYTLTRSMRGVTTGRYFQMASVVVSLPPGCRTVNPPVHVIPEDVIPD